MAINFLPTKCKIRWTPNFDSVSFAQVWDCLIPALWNLVMALLETSWHTNVFGIKDQDILIVVLHPCLVVNVKHVKWLAMMTIFSCMVQDAYRHQIFLDSYEAFLANEKIQFRDVFLVIHPCPERLLCKLGLYVNYLLSCVRCNRCFWCLSLRSSSWLYRICSFCWFWFFINLSTWFDTLWIVSVKNRLIGR